MPHDHHGHHHHHHHVDAETGDRRLAWAVGVNIVLTLAQVVGGILSGSLALIADALHNFSDAVALIIAVLARRIARRPADADMSYGYGRAEMVAALVNYTTLTLLAIYLGYQGVARLFDPQPIAGWVMIWVTLIALAVDLVTAALTFAMSKQSLNIRAAFLHNLIDALASVAVIVAGAAVLLMGWYWVDAVVTLIISGYILMHVRADIGSVIRVLMLGRPRGLDIHGVIEAVRDVDGVEDVHHVHLWEMQEQRPALDAHLVIRAADWTRADGIKAAVKARLGAEFDIGHTTLEMECTRHVCLDPPLIGHPDYVSPNT